MEQRDDTHCAYDPIDCKHRFDKLDESIQKIDTAIRGNGTPGLNTRLDRLEQDKKITHRALWVVFGAVVVAVIGLVIPHVFKIL